MLRSANADFERRLRAVGADDWSRPTPCAGWSVRALVNHVVGGNTRFLMLLGGASAEDTNRTRDLDHLGDDALASFLATAAELEAAFNEDGALGRTVHHRFGDRTGGELLALRAIDMTVYGWDVSRAVGLDEVLDARAVDYALAHAEEVERLRNHGAFAVPDVALPVDASTQERLLYLTGRWPVGEVA